MDRINENFFSGFGPSSVSNDFMNLDSISITKNFAIEKIKKEEVEEEKRQFSVEDYFDFQNNQAHDNLDAIEKSEKVQELNNSAAIDWSRKSTTADTVSRERSTKGEIVSNEPKESKGSQGSKQSTKPFKVFKVNPNDPSNLNLEYPTENSDLFSKYNFCRDPKEAIKYKNRVAAKKHRIKKASYYRSLEEENKLLKKILNKAYCSNELNSIIKSSDPKQKQLLTDCLKLSHSNESKKTNESSNVALPLKESNVLSSKEGNISNRSSSKNKDSSSKTFNLKDQSEVDKLLSIGKQLEGPKIEGITTSTSTPNVFENSGLDHLETQEYDQMSDYFEDSYSGSFLKSKRKRFLSELPENVGSEKEDDSDFNDYFSIKPEKNFSNYFGNSSQTDNINFLDIFCSNLNNKLNSFGNLKQTNNINNLNIINNNNSSGSNLLNSNPWINNNDNSINNKEKDSVFFADRRSAQQQGNVVSRGEGSQKKSESYKTKYSTSIPEEMDSFTQYQNPFNNALSNNTIIKNQKFNRRNNNSTQMRKPSLKDSLKEQFSLFSDDEVVSCLLEAKKNVIEQFFGQDFSNSKMSNDKRRVKQERTSASGFTSNPKIEKSANNYLVKSFLRHLFSARKTVL